MSMSNNHQDKLKVLQLQLSQVIYEVGEIQRKLASIIASMEVQTLQTNVGEQRNQDDVQPMEAPVASEEATFRPSWSV